GSTAVSSAELWDRASDTWLAIAPMTGARAEHVAALLDDGRVLVAGGNDASGALASAELLSLNTAGDACNLSAECHSGFCVDGVCCAEVCDGACEACASAATGQPDGT